MLKSQVWLQIALIPSFRKQRQGNLCDFKASLVYVVSPRTAGLHGKTLASKELKHSNDNKNSEECELYNVCAVLVHQAVSESEARCLRPPVPQCIPGSSGSRMKSGL